MVSSSLSLVSVAIRSETGSLCKFVVQRSAKKPLYNLSRLDAHEMSIIHLALIRDLVVFLLQREKRGQVSFHLTLSRSPSTRAALSQIGHSIGGAELCFFVCWLAKGGQMNILWVIY